MFKIYNLIILIMPLYILKILKFNQIIFTKYPNLQTYKPEVHVRRRSIETLTTWTLAVKAILVKLFVNSDN